MQAAVLMPQKKISRASAVLGLKGGPVCAGRFLLCAGDDIIFSISAFAWGTIQIGRTIFRSLLGLCKIKFITQIHLLRWYYNIDIYNMVMIKTSF